MESVVVSLGGSVLLSDKADDVFFKDLVGLFSRVSKQLRLFIVVGGGRFARSYINHGRKLGFSEKELDLLGIAVTRVNAQFLSFLLPMANKVIPESTKDAVRCSEAVVVMGGTVPGHSTDRVGAELAVACDAVRLVNATNVDGVFDKDPNKFSDAMRFSTIHIDEMIAAHGKDWGAAGKNVVIDGPALGLIQKHGIRTMVVNGFRLKELESAIVGRSFTGTTLLV